MEVQDTTIPEVKLITPKVFGDGRGYFTESYQDIRYKDIIGSEFTFVQDNRSFSKQGILRGLHFQRAHPQGKLVQCVLGSVFDVAVDIRPGSPTRGKWVGEILNDETHKQLWVPPGFAHGFLVLSQEAIFEYKCTDYYRPSDEGAIRYDDQDLNIQWPKLDMDYKLSEKDLKASSFLSHEES
jgi:dTDP-4-dehydrorhamnose 3,5-epimerase